MNEIWLPDDIIDEVLMKMTIKEILEKARTSKRWEERMNTLWCRLLDRDYKIKKDKGCKEIYKNYYKIERDIVIHDEDIEKAINSSIGKNMREEARYIDNINMILRDAFFENYYGEQSWKFNPGNYLILQKIIFPLLQNKLPESLLILSKVLVSDTRGNLKTDIRTYDDVSKDIIFDILRKILPSPFFIYEPKKVIGKIYVESAISISLKNYILIFNYMYENNTFDKTVLDLMKNPIKLLTKKELIRNKYEISNPNKMLKLIHEIADNN